MDAKTEYHIDSRSYLLRGIQNLESQVHERMFYAAFEFRCAAEARMQQYLEAWEHVPNAQKEQWQVGKLSKSLKAAFSGDHLVRIEIADGLNGPTKHVLYYTPCRPRLKALTSELGNYLHAAKKFRAVSDNWWKSLRQKLYDCRDELIFSNTGTLVGPILWAPKKRTARCNIELLKEMGLSPEKIMGPPGDQFTFKVSYPSKLPEPLEPEALVWRCSPALD